MSENTYKSTDASLTPDEREKSVPEELTPVELKIVTTLSEAQVALTELMKLNRLNSITQLVKQGIDPLADYENAPLLLKVSGEEEHKAFMTYIEDNFDLKGGKVDNLIEDAFGLLIKLNSFIALYSKPILEQPIDPIETTPEKEVKDDKKEV